jgi:transcriptional regulator with XRE-family HTH domain
VEESLGPLLTQMRLAQGRSQLRIAELLCAASGIATVTRHEVSRWEREERIPSGFWLRWLALVLDVELQTLERAAVRTRGGEPPRRARIGGHPRRPVRATGGAPPPLPATSDRPAALARIDELRRMDDLVGGADLLPVITRELAAGGRRASAELSQLAGVVAGDADLPASAGRHFHSALRAARVAGDRPLAGHVLGYLSQLYAVRDPRVALDLAEAACAEAGGRAPAGVRALLALRVAHAAAMAGERRATGRALAAADRIFDRRDRAAEPAWVYWLTADVLAAFTGHCHLLLGQARRAVPLLRDGLAQAGARPRAVALYAGWLARAHLDVGDTDAAGAAAGLALVEAVRLGSPRAARQVIGLRSRLHTTRYPRLLAAAAPYLPVAPVGAERPDQLTGG